MLRKMQMAGLCSRFNFGVAASTQESVAPIVEPRPRLRKASVQAKKQAQRGRAVKGSEGKESGPAMSGAEGSEGAQAVKGKEDAELMNATFDSVYASPSRPGKSERFEITAGWFCTCISEAHLCEQFLRQWSYCKRRKACCIL